MKKLYVLIASALLYCSINAQLSIGGDPLSFNLNEVSSQEFEYLEYSALDLNQIQEEDLERESNGQVDLISRYIPVSLNLSNSGTWETLENGDRVWRLKITAREAQAINFIYDDFFLSQGSVMHVYSADHSHILGGFTESNNKAVNIFATGNVLGESAVIELFEPSSDFGISRVQISQIGYVYRNAFPVIDGQLRGSDPCQVDVACSEADNWEDESKGVVRILLTSNQGQGWCSGSLVNNTSQDCTPYILTAFHCGVNSTPGQYSSYIYYFNYQASSCGGSDAAGTQSITGSTRIAYSNDGGGNSGSDFLLTEITQPIPSSIDAYFNGWNAETSSSSSGVSIHHPAGDFKKISTYASSLQSTTWGGPSGTHWLVNWVATANGHGVTEGGSSGSPIFNSNGLIVGQLTGGSSFCDSPNSPDLYGKMSYNWTSNGNQDFEQLKIYLDPTNTGLLSMEGTYAPCIDPSLLGCTDPEAINYNSAAEFDDGSCEYACLEAITNISISLDCYGTETAWQLTNSSSQVVAEVSEGTYSGSEGNAQPGGSQDDQSLCLPAGCYSFTITDSFGEEWLGHSGKIVV